MTGPALSRSVDVHSLIETATPLAQFSGDKSDLFENILVAKKHAKRPNIALKNMFRAGHDQVYAALSLAQTTHLYGDELCAAVISKPHRVIVLESEAKQRRVALLGTYEHTSSDQRFTVCLKLTFATRSPPHPSATLEDSQLQVWGLDESDEETLGLTVGLVAIELEQVHLDSTEPATTIDWRGSRPVAAAWIGEAAPPNNGFVSQIRAIGAVNGIAVKVFRASEPVRSIRSQLLS